ncbi:biotin--[acetyl-CoA-carboxylase] ligase [Exiguobacterium flavidum]|uniref:biotin--[acetyl-CoA-carboxylase] ligase n=1 Tax=Exiguobacterium flavidum TaxID=2184695 RepID=UPI000DF7B789|nr:biotin--[acetyl-CoA-carboxylase] ligase [Exiguobacterium flavidum]
MERTTKELILSQLLRKERISGQELADSLNISRTAIWKQIDQLRKDGYEIDANKKTGYLLLDDGDRLFGANLLPLLRTKSLGRNVVHHEETETTQRIAHELAQLEVSEGTLVLCDHQTQGRGQLGRKWLEEKGKGVAMSLILRPDVPIQTAGQLTILAGIALAESLGPLVEARIKWPNDILVSGKKLAGILTEMQAEADRIGSIIIGIGVNVNHGTFPPEISSRATSLKSLTGSEYKRAEIVARFLNTFESMYTEWLGHGFAPFVERFLRLADRKDELVTLRTRERVLTGILRGITSDGTLLIETEQGMEEFHSAELVYWS